jgi:uncharacterized membrane protein (UPF0136 family)
MRAAEGRQQEQTCGMRVVTGLLVVIAAALWLGWMMRDYHDNQRNWLLWMATLVTAAAVVSSCAALVRSRRLRG